MNNKAQAGNYAIAFMLAVSLIILALAFSPVINVITNLAMGNTSISAEGVETMGMNCSSTTDDFNKAGCLVTDISQSYFIGSLFAIAGLLIIARIIFS